MIQTPIIFWYFVFLGWKIFVRVKNLFKKSKIQIPPFTHSLSTSSLIIPAYGYGSVNIPIAREADFQIVGISLFVSELLISKDLASLGFTTLKIYDYCQDIFYEQPMQVLMTKNSESPFCPSWLVNLKLLRGNFLKFDLTNPLNRSITIKIAIHGDYLRSNNLITTSFLEGKLEEKC